MQSMKLNNCFTTVDNYLNKVSDYLDDRVVKYLYSLGNDYKVLVNGQGVWFENNNYLDEVFSETLFIPKYMVDNLRVVLKNNLMGITLNELHSLKPISLNTSIGKLYQFTGLEIRNQYSSVGLLGINGKELQLDTTLYETELHNTSYNANSTTNTIYTNVCGSIVNANKYILEHWFSKEELLLLDKVNEGVMKNLFKLKTINGFVSLATKDIYSRLLLDDTISKLKDSGISYDEDNKFKFTLNGVDFTFTICYNRTTKGLFPYTFICNDDVKPKFKVYAESRLTEILGNTPLQIKESAKQLQGILDELQGYVEKIKEKLLEECSLGKENFTVITSEYPMDLMTGNINDIICKVLVDFYGNTN